MRFGEALKHSCSNKVSPADSEAFNQMAHRNLLEGGSIGDRISRLHDMVGGWRSYLGQSVDFPGGILSREYKKWIPQKKFYKGPWHQNNIEIFERLSMDGIWIFRNGERQGDI